MVNIQKSPSLVFCIIMDIIGYATYAVPGIAELGDAVWAPISASIFAATFGGKKGMIGGIFNFVEEALPGTDFIPSFTLMWFLTNKVNLFSKKPATNVIKVKAK